MERLTVHLDIALDMMKDNLHNFLAVMKKEQMQPRAPVPAESILDQELLQQFVQKKGALFFTFHDPHRPYRQIDLLLTQETSYEQLINSSDEIRIDTDTTLNVLSV
ncbi:MAG: hypothetical protein JW863_12765 [Chitinispirillaceae bacterium]|nr:hypothetical protein [Chitinispirillaceae bacterium]